MQLARSTLVLAILAALAASAFAKDARTQRQSEETASSDCHAYQQAADGNWVALPCREEGAAKSTHHRTAPKLDHDGAR